MYQHILVATDGSELAGKAVNHGMALAKRANQVKRHGAVLKEILNHGESPKRPAGKGIHRVERGHVIEEDQCVSTAFPMQRFAWMAP